MPMAWSSSLPARHVLAAFLALAALAGAGCGSNADSSNVQAGGPSITTPYALSCDNPGVGCPCTTAGATTDCGQVDRVSGSYVTCSMGTMKCSGGVWGTCVGDRITTKALPSKSDIHSANFGVPAACVNDPCDPSCSEIVDTASGFDAGADSGFSVSDAGITPLPIVEGDGGTRCTGLAVNPQVINVTVTGLSPLVTSPAAPDLNATYLPAGCYSGLANASWSVDQPGLAAISGGLVTLVSAVSGPINVSAYSAGFQASAQVLVTTNVVDTSQVSAPIASALGAVTPGTAPDNVQFLYPYANTVFPRAVAAPIVQWNNNGVVADGVKVTIQYPAVGAPTFSVAGVIPESSPPQFSVNQDAWAYLDQTAAGQDALISIQRVVAGVVLQPVSEIIHFATKPLRGNIFYTEYDVNAWTATIKSAKPYGTTPSQIALANSGCNPCHSVSANGTTLISSNWGNNNTSVAKVNADGTLTGLANMWNASNGQDSRGFAYSAISPDGAYALQGANWWGNTLETTSSQLVSSRPHGNGSGLTGTYYANPNATGTAAFAELDPTVDFIWGPAAPGTGAGIAAGSSYSVSWTGFVQPVFSETYTFETESSDGVVLRVNGQTLVNQWNTQADTKWTGTIALTAGAKVPITLNYKNITNSAQVHLRWSSADQPYEIINETQLFPSASVNGLYGTYYANVDLTGATESRVDPTINFNWNGGTPVGGWSGNNWSAEWTGQAQTPCTGTYQWCVTGDDGVRLWVDGVLVANGWNYQGPTQYCSSALSASAGTQHAVKMDYFQGGGGSVAQLSWNSSCAGSEIIPAIDLTPTAVPVPTTGLLGTYYANIDFTGSAISEIDPTVNFSWNGGSTVAGSSGSNLSAEWTGRAQIPCTDNYEWCVVGDDGVRLWVDGVLVDDGWNYQGATSYCNSVTGTATAETAGSWHDIKMDYFQGGGGSVAQLEWMASCIGPQAQIIPPANLSPSGDQGTGGYDAGFHLGGDRGSGIPYSIISVPSIVNTSPVDVSGQTANTWGLGATAMMVPAFSPDGTKLVFVDGDTSAGASWRQGLSVFDFNEAGRQFSNRRNVVNTVAAGNIIRWPTVESDSRSVIYQTNPTSQDDIGSYSQYGGMLPSGYSSIPGQLWSVDVTDPVDHPPVSLAAANLGLGGADQNRNYQASVLPAAAGGYRWSVFTSDRQYGDIQNVPAPGVTPTTQLWVSALDDTTSAGVDRSHPAFWLPNQVLGNNGGRIRNERAYWVLDACKPSLTSLSAPTVQPSPAFTPSDSDIGSVGLAGSLTIGANGLYTIVAGGDDIWNTNDAFHYAYMPVSGDFQFVARVLSVAPADYWSKGGVMLRDTLSSDSAQTYMMLNSGALSGLQWRSPSGNSSNWTQGPGENFPYWVRLSRSGTTVSGDISSDGINWTNVATQTPAIGTNAYIGLAATAHNNALLTTAVFDNVSFGSTTPPDPRPASVCQDDQDCCGALTSPATAACKVDVPVANPVVRHCVSLTANSCVPVGSACSSDSDCCGFPNNSCTAGTCAVPPPPFTYGDLVFTRDYVASCPAQNKPVWRFFDWETVTPGNSDIKFSAATATSASGLPATQSDPSVVPFGTASGAPATVWTGADVGAALTAAKQSPSLWYLRVFIDFQPTSDHTQGPTLSAWRQQFDCVAAE